MEHWDDVAIRNEWMGKHYKDLRCKGHQKEEEEMDGRMNIDKYSAHYERMSCVRRRPGY